MKKINENQMPEITKEVRWSAYDIRSMCIKNNWYTAGDNRAYSEMLDFVDQNEPTTANIYMVAEDISEHSNTEDNYIDVIMFVISNEVVRTHYTVK